MQEGPSVAILIFARSAQSEAAHKRLLAERGRNRLLHQAILKKITSISRSTDAAIFRFDEHNQQGDDFGMRINNAFKDVFNRGYKKIVAVGGDCPELDNGTLAKAIGLLDDRDAVLGPDFRGGTYLIGLTKSSFDELNLQNLPWRSGDLCKELASRTNAVLLDRKRDLNDLHDTICLVSESMTFRRLVKQITFTDQLYKGRKIFQETLDRVHSLFHRGPPHVIDFSWHC
jgi:hypothetical protein